MSETVKQVRIQHEVNKRLEALVTKRKKELNPSKTKQSIVEELILKAHKREVEK